MLKTGRQIFMAGLDVGSTTAKIAVTDESGCLVYSRYERHNAHAEELVARYFEELKEQLGDVPLRLCVTGSVGMSTAEMLHAEFVQEVVAAAVYAGKAHPEAKALIDIGGEDAKVVFLEAGHTELRMNGNCAGGTGAFLDQMSVLLGTDNAGMDRLALEAKQLHPIAARCGVFAKTDIQNLMARNVPKEEIAASIFHSIAVQTAVTLCRGRDILPPVLLCGGPLTFMPALRKAFSDYLQLPSESFIVTEKSNLIPAMGCAIRSGRGKGAAGPRLISELLDLLRHRTSKPFSSALKPLFSSEEEHRAWLAGKERFAAETVPMKAGLQKAVIGIDSGSTTTKVVALRAEDGAVIFRHYGMNLGDPIGAAAEGLRKLQQEAERQGAELLIAGGCTTGYGEELIRAAFSLDAGIIETMAHCEAAKKMDPDVSFILDIGGQDMKAIFVEQGTVVRMELNEACSSGCGTFIQTFATSLGKSVPEFAALACMAESPCDLGTRCTVFMNSKVKQVLREGATVADISAGIAYSVVKNCLYKVLKLHSGEALGKHVAVQGGTMKNDAVVRAFELLTGTDAARSNMPELMGAYGCALHLLSNPALQKEKAVPLSGLLEANHSEQKMLACKGCENKCLVTRYTFGEGRRFYSGNRCESVFSNRGKNDETGLNIYDFKYEQLFSRPEEPFPEAEPKHVTVGIPRALGMYEDYPFWNTLFRASGISVKLSSKSTHRQYESALRSVMSDNICFPAKLVHGHIAELNEDPAVDRIFMPWTVFERNDDREKTLNSFNCPVVSGYSDVLKSAMDLKKPLDAPVINFADEELLGKELIPYLTSLGVSKSEAKHAIRLAAEEQSRYGESLRRKAEEICAESRKAGRLTLLLAGRPYHTDPLIQHKLSEMAASLGADVISEDIVRNRPDLAAGDTYIVKQWAYVNRITKSAQWAAEQGPDVHFAQMTSFGCGPDAFAQDEVRDILRRHHKPYTLLKIDDVSNTGSLKLRVRSLLESLRRNEEPQCMSASEELKPIRVYRKADRKRKILAPYMSEFLSPLLIAVFRLAGYDVEVLPESDEESAELGLKNANNEVCYPATLIVGDIIKALKSGRYDLKNTAVAMSQTGGQCRATSYAGLIKRAMAANGFADVPLITLGVTSTAGGGNEQEGFGIPWLKYSGIIVTGMLYGDAISQMYYATAVREKEKGLASRLKEKWLSAAAGTVLKNDPAALIRQLSEAAREFNAAALDLELPKVGIVGEIFLKFNAFAHQQVESFIMEHGAEVVPPLLTPFFMQEFVNVQYQKELGLSRIRVPGLAVRSAYQVLVGRRTRQVNRAASAFRYFRPFGDIYEEARGAIGITSPAAQFGEGWLLPADIAAYVRDGVTNVISLQPFGCIANHIISKGIEKELGRRFPQLSLLSLDFDSGVSRVNVANRLLLFLESLKAPETERRAA